jgi:parallel beta-helix repeat protein
MRVASQKFFILCVVFALLAAAVFMVPSPARADDPLPPPEEPAVTEETGEAVPTEELPSEETGEAVPTEESSSEEPVQADLAETIAVLNEAGAVLLDADGNPIPLATADAAAALGDPDPYIVRGGTTYSFTAADCDPLTAGNQPCPNPIQAAIDFALDGEVIFVEPGTYQAQLFITKSITLQGTAPGVTIQSPADIANCYTTTQQNQAIVCVTGASNASLIDITVDGAGRGNLNYRFVGVGYFNAGGTIQGSSVIHITDTPFSGAQHGTGIYVYNNGAAPRDISIIDNTVTDFQKSGIVVTGDNLNAVIQDNTVTGAGPTSITAQNGIQVSGGATALVDGNTVSGVYYTGAGWTASGILLYDPGDGTVVTNNNVENAQTGIYAYRADDADISGNTINGGAWSLFVDDSDNVTVSGNTITDSESDGIDICDSDGVTVTGNTIRGAAGDGIWVGGCSATASNITITDNLIENNGNGGLWPDAGGIHITDGADVETLTITGNVFTGNLHGVSNSTEGAVVALGNFWGCSAGPDDPACDPVYGDVLYDPWLPVNPFLPPVVPPQPQLLPGAAPLPGAPRRATLPVTGGEVVDISCEQPVTRIVLNNAHRVEFSGLCGYQAMLEEIPAAELAGALPDGKTYVAGLRIRLFYDGNPVEVLPSGASIAMEYLLNNSQVNEAHTVLYWNTDGNAWTALPTLSQAPGPVPLAGTNDGRLVLAGSWTTAEQFVRIELNFTGDFVLATP